LGRRELDTVDDGRQTGCEDGIGPSRSGGDPAIGLTLAALINDPSVEAANRTAFARYLEAQPVLVDVMLARDAIPALAGARRILHEQAGVCNRATFIVDPDGIIRQVTVNDLKVGRNVEEVLRVLDGPYGCPGQARA
jgi:hypothetical protein